MDFATVIPNPQPDAIAPDGSEVRLLGGVAGGTMASFTLPAGTCSMAVTHRKIEELWVVVSGAGQMWRKQGEREEIVDLKPGMGLSIPLGTDFQFRAGADAPFVAAGVTMPPWPGHDEAIPVEGPWRADQPRI